MKTIDELQSDIDKIDNDLLVLLGERKKIVTLVARYKSGNHIQIRDTKREKELLSKLLIQAKLNDLDPGFVTKLYNVILKNSRDEQKKY